MLKKIIGIGLLFVLVLSLSACYSSSEINNLNRRITDLETNRKISDEKIKALEEENQKLKEQLDRLDKNGDGTEAYPYIIQTAYQLKTFADAVNDGENYTYTYFALGTDIDLGGKEWTPIGIAYDCPFEGVFNGRGYTITNFKITTAVPYPALFGYNNGSIKNLGAENFAVDINSGIDGSVYAGGLVGYNSNTGALFNCYAKGNVTVSASPYYYSQIYAGGLAGYNSGMITNCHAECDVSASIEEIIYPPADLAAVQYNTDNQITKYTLDVAWEPVPPPSCDIFAGGLTGKNNGIINTCFVTGNVTTINNYPSYNYTYAGGLMGFNETYTENSTITNCHATGAVSATASGTAVVGGLIGFNEAYTENSTITNCYATGDIDVNSNYSFAGGLIGENYYTEITNCYATGDVTADSDYSACAGGLIGGNYYSIITNCYAIGDVSAISDILYTYAGGLIGDAHNSTITNCYATGDVNSDSSYHYSYAGGLIGYTEYLTITNCYATGNISASAYDSAYAGGLIGKNYTTGITNCYATGDVTANSDYYAYAGGLIGSNHFLTITNCYATGDVTATALFSISYVSVYVGGLMGYNYYSTITNCYAAGDIIVYSYDNTYAGGLIGTNNYYSTITNCYATGNIIADSDYAVYAGGLVGSSETTTTIDNCYRYDRQNIYRKNNDGAYNTPSNTFGASVSASRLDDEAFYVYDLGWDSATWNFTNLDFESGKYPKLRVNLID